MGNYLSRKVAEPLLVPPCLNGDVEALRAIILTKTDEEIESMKNLPGPDGSSPLVCAAFKGSVECVDELLQIGADPTVKNIGGHDAVWVACGYNQGSVLELFLEWAEKGERRDLAQFFIDSKNDKGDSPLLAR